MTMQATVPTNVSSTAGTGNTKREPVREPVSPRRGPLFLDVKHENSGNRFGNRFRYRFRPGTGPLQHINIVQSDRFPKWFRPGTGVPLAGDGLHPPEGGCACARVYVSRSRVRVWVRSVW